MARWKLLNAHHLNVPGNKWEYKETNRTTGKQERREFDVPQHLNPFDPSDWNYHEGRDEGYIVVTNKASAEFPRDYVFLGDPTPDMLPLDDEAVAISATFAGKWKHPIENMTTSYSQSLIDNFHTEMEALRTKAATAEPSAELKTMADAITKMAEMQANLMQALATKPTADRRI